MVIRRPVVLNSGLVSDLLDGDTVVAGNTTTQITTTSGVAGGGSLSSNPFLSVSLNAQPSGLLITGQGLAIDGASLVTATRALASGSAAAFNSTAALASGNAALSTAVSALASGNAALANLPTGGGNPVITTRANSNLTAGDPVGLDDSGGVQLLRKFQLNSLDGVSLSNPQSISATYNGYLSVVSLDTARFVLTYSGSSSYPTSVVAVVSGTTITYGTPTVAVSISTFLYTSTYAGPGKIVVIYPLGAPSFSYQSHAVVGTISGTSISFGTGVSFGYSNNSYPHGGVYDPVQNKVIVFSSDLTTYNKYGRVGTVSGSSISFGSNFNIGQNWSSQYGELIYNSVQAKTLFIYCPFQSFSLAVSYMTVSGTTITVNNAATLGLPFIIGGTKSVYCTAQDKTLITYRASSKLYGVIFSLSGSAASFGTPFLISNYDVGGMDNVALDYDVTVNKARITYTYSDQGVLPRLPVTRYITVSGTSASLGPITYVNNPATSTLASAFNTTLNQQLIATPSGSSGVITSFIATPSGTANYILPTLSGYNNFIGTAASSVSSGSLVSVNLASSLVYRQNADLQPNLAYYVGPTTSGFTTASGIDVSWEPQTPWTLVAKAISTSGLLLLDSV